MKNRERLLAGALASRFLAHSGLLARGEASSVAGPLLGDGTQIEAWASIKSFQAIDEEPPGEDVRGWCRRPQCRPHFHGARWSNETHRSTTDDDCRLYRMGRGKEAKLSYMAMR